MMKKIELYDGRAKEHLMAWQEAYDLACCIFLSKGLSRYLNTQYISKVGLFMCLQKV